MSSADRRLAELETLVAPYLERQHWFHDALGPLTEEPVVSIESGELLAGSWDSGDPPGLARLIVAAGQQRFQLVLGWRDSEAVPDALGGREVELLGTLPTPPRESIIYEALADESMLLALLEAASGGKDTARRARVVESLTSHSSVIYDDRLFMKLYRVLAPAPRREVEVMLRLDDAGFNHMVAPVALWNADGFDLALVREFVSGALEGRALAITSLRDLLGSAGDPLSDEIVRAVPDGADEAASGAGGDLAGEMRRLGAMSARMHIALANAFGEAEPDMAAIATTIAESGDRDAAARVEAMHDGGRAIRVNGDYHLRRVMRTDVGWIVVGFGDDPSPLARLDPSRPVGLEGVALEDVADMCHSLREVADEVAADYIGLGAGGATPTLLTALAEAWARRNVAALIDGYLTTPGIRRLLPGHPAAFHLLLSALETVRADRAGRIAAD